MKKIYLNRFLVCLVLAFSAGEITAQVVYVKQDASGADNGTSWLNAYKKLDDALLATTSGQIWVAAGTYKPGGLSPTFASVFSVKSNVSLYGGFVGTETSLAQRNPAVNLTTLSGDINGNDISEVFTMNKTDNTRHVVYVDSLLSSTVAIDGFSIIGGHTSDVAGDPQYERSGGGIFGLSPVQVSNCSFYNNFGRSGGSIYLAGGAGGSQVLDCSFTKNSSSDQCAGALFNSISNISVQRCEFSENVAVRGALHIRFCSDVTIDSCHFEKNTNTVAAGSGLYNFNCTDVSLSNSDFLENEATNSGAVYYDGDQLSITDANNFYVENCSFINNHATAGVSGAFRNLRGSYTLDNCWFEGNTSTGSGGNIRNDTSDDNIFYQNCTFKSATSGGWGGAHTCYGTGNYIIKNCVYENNSAPNYGGAMNCGFRANVLVDSCTFASNTSVSSSGGAIAMQNDSTSLMVLNSTFTNNECLNSGGAIFGGAGSVHVVVDKCEFTTNGITGADGVGGAIAALEGGNDDIGSLVLSNSVFLYNTAPVQAGALNLSNVDATIYSCLFTNNIASGIGTGGAISNNCDSNVVEVQIMNTTFADNVGALAGGLANWTGEFESTSNTTLQNCIFRQDGLLNYAIEAGTPALLSNGGNLSDDATMADFLTHPKDIHEDVPDFVDPDDFNYRLAMGSLGIDGGVNDNAPDFDLDGNPRYDDVDMGAYEYQKLPSGTADLLPNNGALKLSPNPATGSSVGVLVQNNWTGTLRVRLFDVTGRLVREIQADKNSPQAQFDFPLDGVKTGVYDLLIFNEGRAISEGLLRF
ncbi:MAG: T9SS type A sorting domain-containing protein [Bacteroidetes bacterium]|nr:T9SS type A sorting domain-containing protein [Bacteroidota bacterium]